MTLEAKFRALTQGNLPVLEYAQRLKDLADGLADLDQPVSDATLLLALLCGINEPLCNMASILKTKDPLPTFLQAQSLLALEESELPAATSATALVATRNAAPMCMFPRLRRPRRLRRLWLPLLLAHLLALGVAGRAAARAATSTPPGVGHGHGTIRGTVPSRCGLSPVRAFWELAQASHRSRALHTPISPLLIRPIMAAAPLATASPATAAARSVLVAMVPPATASTEPTPTTTLATTAVLLLLILQCPGIRPL